MLDLHTPSAEDARSAISAFAELVASPEHLHSYRISNLSLWNAASAGLDRSAIEHSLVSNSRYPVPQSLLVRISDTLSRFGKLILVPGPNDMTLQLEILDRAVQREVEARREIRKFLQPQIGEGIFHINLMDRGNLKQACMKQGYPIEDRVPLVPGDPFPVALRADLATGASFALRPYQKLAVSTFIGGSKPGNGYGVVVLPCGAGKTIVGMGVMAELGYETLIIAPNITAVRQWIREILAKTSVNEADIGEYSGEKKEIRPITVASYQILTWRAEKDAEFAHFGLFRERKWGLVIYDEVHLLPAPVFRMTAEIQSRHRLGLTATLVREDGLETDVFSLVGPKRYDISWRDVESLGFIAKASCREYRIELPNDLRLRYVACGPRDQARIAAENPGKIPCVQELIHKHSGEHILIIGQYLEQLEKCAAIIKAPLITGRMPNAKRDELYQAFREGKQRILIVSKVANFAVDLPDASVAIQISGSFGSRQEEAQRLGRIMRPKEQPVVFYSLVSRYTVEEEFSLNRQRFLGEQGYTYIIDSWELEEQRKQA